MFSFGRDHLRANGLGFVAVTPQQLAAAENDIVMRASIINAPPERLADPHFRSLFKGKKVELFVVDEAHYVSQWGHDFRRRSGIKRADDVDLKEAQARRKGTVP